MPFPRVSLPGSILAAVVLASCGGGTAAVEGDTPLPTRIDGGGAPSDAAAAPDVPPAIDASIPACDVTKPFGAPVAVTELNTTDEDFFSDLSSDGLTAYVASNHAVTGLHLFFATRASTSAPFGPLQLLFPKGNFNDLGAALTADALTAIVSSDRNGSNTQLYIATRTTTLASFGALPLVAGINSSSGEGGPRWSADGKTLYFDSTRSGHREIYRSAVVGSTFSAPQLLTELSTKASLDAFPVLSPDELTIYFESARPPSPEGDIYVATRATTAAPFANIQQLANVNSPSRDAPGQISPDGCTLYLSSDRAGKSDIFVANRQK